MNTEALALELRNEMHTFLNELIDEFGTEGTISHDTFNKAINIRSNIIADSDLWDGKPYSDTESKCNKHIVSGRFSNDELERRADGCFLAITSYSPRNELGGIERKWIVKCIYKALKLVNDS